MVALASEIILKVIAPEPRESARRGQDALAPGKPIGTPASLRIFKFGAQRVLDSMNHPIYRVVSFEIVGPYRIHVRFNDETTQDIDFRPVLEGELFGPPVDEVLFNQVRIDSEVHTLIWSNGADFDPATLHDWPVHEEELRKMAGRWSDALTANERG